MCFWCVNDACSSDEDIDAILRGTAEQQRRHKRLRELREEKESSSEDEFEKEMESELNAKMKKIERQWAAGDGIHYFVCFLSILWTSCLQCFDAVQLGSRKSIRPVKTEWWGVGMVVCLEWGADFHMDQLMPLPLTVSCFRLVYLSGTSSPG